MSRSALHLALAWAALLQLSCQRDGAVQAPPISVQFRDVAETAGLRFDHFNGFSGEYYYVETFGSGAGFIDFDSDGYLDVYLVNGAALADTTPEPRPRNQLFRNESGRSFRDVTTLSGAGDEGYGMGCAVADVEGDGDQDLFVTNFGPDVFLTNDGDGHFSDVTAALGLGDPRWSTGSGFLDYDMDGDVDLFVVHYVDFSLEENAVCRQGRIRSYCDPDSYDPVPDALYRNDGGRFSDVTREAGISGLGRGLGLILADLDWDGDTDVYVANDGDMNHLYENGGVGTFTEVSLELGVSFNDDGRAEASMGVDVGDVDGDGLRDLFVTNFALETHTLYARRNSGEYEDATDRLGLAEPTFMPLGFGARLLDYDNDRDLDLFVANGHVMDVVAQVHAGQTYRQPNQMLMNSAGERFEDVSNQLGPGLEPVLASRAAAVADYDNDGDLDLLVTNVSAPPTLLRNDGGNRNHWLLLSLAARRHPDALGTRVTLTAGGTRQLRERRSASSYLSSHDPRLHFGLGDATRADIEIQWPDGTVQLLTDIPADQILRIVQPSE